MPIQHRNAQIYTDTLQVQSHSAALEIRTHTPLGTDSDVAVFQKENVVCKDENQTQKNQTNDIITARSIPQKK